MFSRAVQHRLAASLRARSMPSSISRQCVQRRWMTRAPKPGDGPLMSRRADRELPDINEVRFRWRRTMPIFIAIVVASSVAIFNYQKSSSPVVASTLYALRTSPQAREVLGDDIYFKHQIPWIRGELNQVQGRIDIHFPVAGTRGVAEMRFTSRRPTAKGLFETFEWSLTTEDGRWIDLLEGGDPFKVLLSDGDDEDEGFMMQPMSAAGQEHATRGFRQQGNYNK